MCAGVRASLTLQMFMLTCSDIVRSEVLKGCCGLLAMLMVHDLYDWRDWIDEPTTVPQ